MDIDTYQLAEQYIRNTNRCLFITGKAGTGKTTFLRRLQLECPKRMAIVAPTGVAAINAEGVTVHSFLQLPPQVFLPTPAARKALFAEMQMRGQKRKVLQNLELLVIDEVSMVRADLLDTIDVVLRRFKHHPNLPFGGVQVIFIGDLFQLSPVVRDADWQLLRDYYSGPYFFQSQVMQQLNPVYIEFDHIFRQSDPTFINILNEVRNNILSPQHRERLNACYNPTFRNDEQDYHIILSTHNYKVDGINQKEIDRIDAPAYTYEATITGTFPESAYPMDTHLTLKVGARVMFLRNDIRPEKLFYNGKLGIVEELTDEYILVRCGEEEPIEVPLMEWENLRYITDSKSDDIKVEVAGTFRQYPLRLAWAVTIHKAQGLTFDRVVIDAADAFACGQVYVALSRCRSLEGIVLLNKIPDNALTNDTAVLAFTDSQPAISEVQSQYPAAGKDYHIAMLCSVFDFRPSLEQMQGMQTFITKHTSYGNTANDFLKNSLATIEQLCTVGEQFQRQIRSVMNATTPDINYLSARLQAAADYFSPLLQQLMEQFRQSPLSTDNKTDARNFDPLAEEFLQDMARKQLLMQQLPNNPTVEHYFQVRSTFRPDAVRFTSLGDEQNLTTDNCSHPLLLQALRQLRRQKAEDYEVRAFHLASNALILDIADKLPVTRQQLLKLKGFGSKKYTLWGEEVLQTVQRYMTEQGIEYELPSPEQTKPARKRQKGDSAIMTFALLQQGKTIAEIMQERQLAQSTIASHLYEFVRQGILHSSDLTPGDAEIIQDYIDRYIDREE